ncbi:MAG: hypothetical protein FJ087_10680 [Deltaproteobacteria bacterium]|nr:hypothetical protein [Deltaproteobacteria bacterium]
MAARGYKRTRIWINAGFQLKWTLMISGVAAAILVILGILYASALAEQRRILGAAQLGQPASAVADPTADEFDRDLAARAEEEDRAPVLVLAGVAAALVAVLAYLGVLLTFRAAGPVFAVSRMLRSMSAGDFKSLRKLRERDEFRFLEDDLYALRDALRREAEVDRDRLARAAEALRSAGAPEVAADLEVAAKAKAERFGI